VDYEKPTVVDYGDVAELTAAQAAGSVTDAKFEAGTPEEDITFS
jgi:beta-lactam-binding protein with PASTA domain